jgi:hypothetical protein
MKPIISILTSLLIILIVFPISLQAADGSGTATISNPQPIVAGSSGNTITFVFRAAEKMDGGQLRVIVPGGGTIPWSQMGLTPGVPGYVEVKSSGKINPGGISTSPPNSVTVPIDELPQNGSITIVYGSGSGNSGVVASSKVGRHVFQVQSALPGGTLTDIGAPPDLFVTADGSGTIEIDPDDTDGDGDATTIRAIGGASDTEAPLFGRFKFRYTAVGAPAENPNILNGGHLLVEIPAEWPRPQGANPSAPGYVVVTERSANVQLKPLTLFGRQVRIPVTQMSGGETFTLEYYALDVPLTQTAPFLASVRANDRELRLPIQLQVLISSILPGPGRAIVSPGLVSAGDKGVQLNFVYTAARAIENGEISLTIPEGWTSPQRQQGIAGYITVDVDDTPSNYLIQGREITIRIPRLEGNGTVTIRYGEGSGSSGATAPTNLGTQTFVIASKIRQTSTRLAIASNPIVQVTNVSDGSGEITVVGLTHIPSGNPLNTAPSGEPVSLTFQYDPVGPMDGGKLSITVPEGWSPPQGDPTVAGYTRVPPPPGGQIRDIEYTDRTVTIEIDRLSVGQPLTVIYGGSDIASAARVQRSGIGNATFNVKSQGSANSVLVELIDQPSVEVSTAPDGSGTAEITPKFFNAGNTGVTVNIVYTASGAIANGIVEVQTPVGWRQPQGQRGIEGFTVANIAGKAVTPDINGGSIKVPINSLAGGQSVTITYGAEGGASGITVPPVSGTAFFAVRSQGGNTGNPTDLTAISPDQLKIVVGSAEDGTGTMTVSPTSVIAGTEVPVLTFIYTAEGQIASGLVRLYIPDGWTRPQNANPVEPGFTTTSGGRTAAPVFSGNIITIPDVHLSFEEQLRIDYKKVTPPPTPQIATFRTQSRASGPGTTTDLVRGFPQIEVVSADGRGEARLSTSPSALIGNSSGNQLNFGFTAGVDLNSGRISIDLPAGWSLPQKQRGTAGYTTVEPAAKVGEWRLEDRKLIVPIVQLAKGDTITVKYGSGGGNSGVSVPEKGEFIFEVASAATPNGTLTPLSPENQPRHIILHASNGSGTATISPPAVPVNTSGLEITINFRAQGVMDGGAIQIDVPETWSQPHFTKGIRGYTVVTSRGGQVRLPEFFGRIINVPITRLRAGDSIQVVYGKGGGDSGVEAKAVGLSAFTVSSASTGARQFTPIKDQPPPLNVFSEIAQLTVTTHPDSVSARQSVRIHLSVQDELGNTVWLPEPLQLTVTSNSGTGRFDTSQNGTFSARQLNPTLQGEQSSLDMYYRDTKTGIKTLTASTTSPNGKFIRGQGQVTITPGPVAEIRVSANPQSLPADNRSTTIISASAHDSYDNLVPDAQLQFTQKSGSGNFEGEPIKSDGVWTAIYKAGTVVEEAVLEAEETGGVKNEVRVTLTKPTITRIELEPKAPKVLGTQRVQFQLRAFDNQGELPPIDNSESTWTVEGNLGTLDENGVLTAPRRLLEGTRQGRVRATLKADSAIFDFTELLTVEAETPQRIDFVEGTKNTFSAGESYQFQLASIDQYGNEVAPISTARWSFGSGSEKIGSLNPSTGVFTAKTVGSDTVVAEVGNTTLIQLIRVTQTAEVNRIEMETSSTHLVADGNSTATLSATPFDVHGNPVPDEAIDITIESGDGTLSRPTRTAGEKYTATYTSEKDATGLVTISATVRGRDNINPARVTLVLTSRMTRMSIEPEIEQISASTTQTFTVIALDQAGESVPLQSPQVGWELSNKAIGEISRAGVFTASQVGRGTVTATLQAQQVGENVIRPEFTAESNPFDVIAGQLDRIQFRENPPATMTAGETFQAAVDGFDAENNSVQTTGVQWEASGGIGQVDNTGNFTATTVGNGTIQATVGVQSITSTEIRVIAGAPERAEITVNPTTITTGSSQQSAIEIRLFDAHNNSVSNRTFGGNNGLRLVAEPNVVAIAQPIRNGAVYTTTYPAPPTTDEASVTLSVILPDGTRIDESQTISLNHPPVINPSLFVARFGSVKLLAAETRISVDLSGLATDPDNDPIFWRVENSDSRIRAQIDNPNQRVDFQIGQINSDATVSIEFIATDSSDGSGGADRATVEIELTTEDIIVIVSPKSGDVVRGTLPVVWRSTATFATQPVRLFAVSADDGNLTPLAELPNNPDSQTVNINRLNDGRYVIQLIAQNRPEQPFNSGEFFINNRPPTFVDPVPRLPVLNLGSAPIQRDLNNYLDAGEDPASIQWSLANPPDIVSTRLVGNQPTIEIGARNPGRGTLQITATDTIDPTGQNNLSATLSLPIRVNTPIAFRDEFPHILGVVVGETRIFPFNQMLVLDTEDSASIQSDSPNNPFVQVDAKVDRLEFVGRTVGETRLQLTASDGETEAQRALRVIVIESETPSIQVLNLQPEAVITENVDAVIEWVGFKLPNDGQIQIQLGNLTEIVPASRGRFVLPTLADGRYIVTLTAPELAQSDAIPFFIDFNPPPLLNDEAEREVVINLKEAAVGIDLTGTFIDPQGLNEPLRWARTTVALDGYVAVDFQNLAAGRLQVTPLRADQTDPVDTFRLTGSSEIRLSVSNHVGGPESSTRLMIITENYRPTPNLDALNRQQVLLGILTPGATYATDVSALAADGDGDAVRYDFSATPDTIQPTIAASNLEFHVPPDTPIGRGTVTLIADDRKGGRTEIPIETEIIEAPEPIVFEEVEAERQAFTFNLRPYFSPNVQWDFEVAAETDAPFTAEISGDRIILRGEPHQFGGPTELTITALAQPPHQGSVNLPISVDVTPINDAPILSIPDETSFPEDETFRIPEAVTDPDLPSDTLAGRFTDAANLTGTLDGRDILITPRLNWHGTETLIVIVTDVGGLSDQKAVRVTVTPVPEAPILTLPPEGISFEEDDAEDPNDDSRWVGNLAELGWANDDDQQPEELQWEVINAQPLEYLTATVAGSILTIIPKDPDWHETEELVLRATDQNRNADGTENRQSAEGNLRVTVTPVDEPPRITPFDPIEFREDTVYRLDLTGHATDDEPSNTPAGTIRWRADPTGNLTIAISSTPTQATITPDRDWHGEGPTITLWATDNDGKGKSTSTPVEVTVTPDAERPELKDFSVKFKEDGEQEVDLADYFTDDDTPATQADWELPDGEDEHIGVRFEAGGPATFFSKVTDWSGTTVFTLQAIDEDGLKSSPATVTVTVTPEDDPPLLNLLLPIMPGPAANRTIRVQLRDDTGGNCHVRAFYRLAANGRRTRCELADMDMEGWIPVESVGKQNGVDVELIWFSGLGELANTVVDIDIELEARDATGNVGRLVIADYQMDNTAKTSPRLEVREVGKGNGGITVIVTLDGNAPTGLDVKFRPADNPNRRWQPASFRNPDGDITSGTISEIDSPSSITWLHSIDTPTGGIYQLQWTPVLGVAPVGPAILTTHTVSSQPPVKIFPESRIITPAHVGYNDTLSVLVQDDSVTSSRFAIFDLGGFRVYEAAENSHRTLANGWVLYTWNGRAGNQSGGQVAGDGLYIYLLIVDGQITKGTFALAR